MSYLKRRVSCEYYFCEHTSWSSPQDFNPLGSQTQFTPPRPVEFASRYRNRENGWNNNGTDNTAIVAGITARNHRPRGSSSVHAGRLHESYITSAVCPLGIGNRVENEQRRYIIIIDVPRADIKMKNVARQCVIVIRVRCIWNIAGAVRVLKRRAESNDGLLRKRRRSARFSAPKLSCTVIVMSDHWYCCKTHVTQYNTIIIVVIGASADAYVIRINSNNVHCCWNV